MCNAGNDAVGATDAEVMCVTRAGPPSGGWPPMRVGREVHSNVNVKKDG